MVSDIIPVMNNKVVRPKEAEASVARYSIRNSLNAIASLRIQRAMIPERYTLQNLVKAARDPSEIVGEIERLKNIPVKHLHERLGKRLFTSKYGEGIDFMERDWDTLVLLDACRYDIFERHNDIEGDLTRVISRGSHSREFIAGNFNGRQFHDTVYITANPFADTMLEDDVFHKVIKTYGSRYTLNDGLVQAHPKRVTRILRENYEQFADKRLIVHFMQPHTPYLGPTADEIRSRLSANGIHIGDGSESDEGDTTVRSILKAAQHGYVSDADLRQCYVENLELVLEYVEELFTTMDGKSVLSSDHGELLGDPTSPLPTHRKYSHGPNLYFPETRAVPWLEVESGPRRDVTADPPLRSDHVSDESVTEQLKALGYQESG